ELGGFPKNPVNHNPEGRNPTSKNFDKSIIPMGYGITRVWIKGHVGNMNFQVFVSVGIIDYRDYAVSEFRPSGLWFSRFRDKPELG
ncbi:8192_t:CDS:2, partial [Funneliformis geosporum]